MTAEIIRFGKSGAIKTLTREQHVANVLAMGHPAGPKLSALAVVQLARASAWREIHRIATEAPEAWEPVEREWIGDVSQITDPAILKDLSELAALAVATDLMIEDLVAIDVMLGRRPAPGAA